MYVCIGIYLYIVRAILLHDTTSQIIGSRSGGGLPGGHVGGTWRANWFVVVRSSFVVRLHVWMDGSIPYDRYALELGLFETTVRSAHATSNKQTANSNRNKKGSNDHGFVFRPIIIAIIIVVVVVVATTSDTIVS